MKDISRLHYITTSAALAEAACQGGVDWIQLRLKQVSEDTYLGVAREVQAVCRQYGATLIINDNVAIAAAVDADGVHLGKTDLNPIEARKMLGSDRIIGCTTNTRSDIIKRSEWPIDYFGLGPFRFTATKEKLSPVIGVRGYRRILESISELSVRAIPVIAIGGITEKDLAALFATGIHGVAVSGAISGVPDVQKTATNFAKAIQLQKMKQNQQHLL